MNVRRLSETRMILGEGPYWDPKDQVLYSLDIRGHAIWRFDPATDEMRSWKTPQQPSAITRTEDDRFIVVLWDGLYEFVPETGEISEIVKVVDNPDEVQLNDAKVDRQGRLIVGGLHTRFDKPLGSLWSFDGKNLTTLDTGFTSSNGPCFSLDGRTLFIADSIAEEIYAYDYDTETGGAANRRVFFEYAQIGGGAPDGSTVDADGRLWSAACGGGKIACIDPDGSLHRVIETELKWPSSVQFGGKDLDTMFVTSIDAGIIAETLEGDVESLGLGPDPMSGYLYAIEGLGTSGVAETPARALG